MGIKKESIFQRVLEATGSPKAVQLAEMLDVTEQTISQYKTLKSFPSLETIALVSDLSGTSIHWLLTGEGEKYVGASVTDVATTPVASILAEDTQPNEWVMFSSLVNGRLVIRLRSGEIEQVYTVAMITHDFSK